MKNFCPVLKVFSTVLLPVYTLYLLLFLVLTQVSLWYTTKNIKALVRKCTIAHCETQKQNKKTLKWSLNCTFTCFLSTWIWLLISFKSQPFHREILIIPPWIYHCWLPHAIQRNTVGAPIMGIHKTLTDTWIWKLGLRLNNFFYGNI